MSDGHLEGTGAKASTRSANRQPSDVDFASVNLQISGLYQSELQADKSAVKPRVSALRMEGADNFDIHCDFQTLKILYKNERDRNRQLEETIGSLHARIAELVEEKDTIIAQYEGFIARLQDMKELDKRVEELQREKARKATELSDLSASISKIKESRPQSVIQSQFTSQLHNPVIQAQPSTRASEYDTQTSFRRVNSSKALVFGESRPPALQSTATHPSEVRRIPVSAQPAEPRIGSITGGERASRPFAKSGSVAPYRPPEQPRYLFC